MAGDPHGALDAIAVPNGAEIIDGSITVVAFTNEKGERQISVRTRGENPIDLQIGWLEIAKGRIINRNYPNGL